jgi:hypothetical protein
MSFEKTLFERLREDQTSHWLQQYWREWQAIANELNTERAAVSSQHLHGELDAVSESMQFAAVILFDARLL